MALNLSQKQEVVAELAEVAAKAHSLVAAEYAGTTVEQMTAMRKKARESGVYLRVVKNTLASRAVPVPSSRSSRTPWSVRCCTRSRRKNPVLPGV